MSNPTTHVESFSGSLGGFSGVDPIRYDGGLWLEQGTTNMWPNPDAFVDTAGVATDLGVEGTLSRDVSSGVTSFHLERTGAGGNPTNLYNSARFPGIAGGDELVFAADIRSPDAGGGIRLVCQLVTWTDADVFVSSDFGSSIPITSSYARYESKFVVPATAGKGIWGFRFEDPGGLSVPVGADMYIRRMQVEASGYATSPAPEVDGSGDALAGYAFTGTAHASSSTRAASSASLTIDEPVSVACWYREGYSGAKQFAYLDTLGQLGDHGDISYAAGDLTISTSRNLVIGPFATFDRALTEDEQARLAATQSWSLSTVLPGGGFGQMQRARLRACSFMGVR